MIGVEETIAVWLCGVTCGVGIFCGLLGQHALREANRALEDARKFYDRAISDGRALRTRITWTPEGRGGSGSDAPQKRAGDPVEAPDEAVPEAPGEQLRGP